MVAAGAALRGSNNFFCRFEGAIASVSDMLAVAQVAMSMYRKLFLISNLQPRVGEDVAAFTARIRGQSRLKFTISSNKLDSKTDKNKIA